MPALKEPALTCADGAGVDRARDMIHAYGLKGCLALPVLALLSQLAMAQPVPPADHFRLELGAGLEYSDNRQRDERFGENDLLLVPRARYELLHTGERLQARGDGELQYEQTFGGSSDSRLRARLGLLVDWSILPQRLYWTFQDIADVQAIDPLRADGADNLQQTNIFLTGPVLLFGSPRTVSGRIEARVARAWAEEVSAFNHDRYSLTGWVKRQSDPVRSWSLGLEHSEVRFHDGPRFADFERQDLVIRHDHQQPRLGLQLVAGHSWIDRVGGDSLARPLYRFNLRWTPTAAHQFGLLYQDELSDAGRDLAFELDATDRVREETRRALVGSEIYRLRHAGLEWRHRSTTTEFSLSPFVRDYDYSHAVDPADIPPEQAQFARGLHASATKRLSETLLLHAHASAAWYEFDQLDRNDRDLHLGLTIERVLSTHWVLRSGYARYLRRSDAIGESYHENRLSIYIIYTIGR